MATDSDEAFVFAACVTWLKERADDLRQRGCEVAVFENEKYIPSILLRVDAADVMGDLLVRDDGLTDSVVAEVASGAYLVCQHDHHLRNATYRESLQGLFLNFYTQQ